MADVQSFDLPLTVEVSKINLQRWSRAGSHDSISFDGSRGVQCQGSTTVISMPSYCPQYHAIDCLWIVTTFPDGLSTSL